MLGLFVTCLTELPGAETAFSLYFSKDADMWECAVHTMGRQVMELLALDQSTALQSCRVWPWLTSKQRKCALNACAWPLGCSYVDDGLWCRIGYAQAFDPFAESPQAVKRAFRAAKLKPYDVTAAEILQMKQAAQSEYRQQVA